jgi:hypothetical protein
LDKLATRRKFVECLFDQRAVEMSGNHNHVWCAVVIPDGRSRNEVTTSGKCGGRHEKKHQRFSPLANSKATSTAQVSWAARSPWIVKDLSMTSLCRLTVELSGAHADL